MVQLLAKLIFIALSGGFLVFGAFIYFQNRKGYLNRLFFLCAVVIAYRSLCEGEMRSAGSLDEAVFWANASFLRVFALALLLHFMLYYTGFWHSLNRFVAWGVVYVPAALFSFVFLVAYDKREMLTCNRYGWMFGNSFPSSISQFHLAWALLLGLTATGLLWAYYLRTKGDERTKIRTSAIIFTHVVLVAVSVSLLQRFHMVDLYFFNGIVTLIAALFMGFLIWRYRLLLSPELVMEEVFSSMEDGLIIIGNDGTLIKVNAATLRLTGYTERELQGKPATLILSHDFLNDSAPVERLNNKGPAFLPIESVIVTRTGTIIPVRCTASIIGRRGGGAGAARIVLFHDLTPYKAIEGELQKAQKLETFELLTRSIAHDFNNLLSSISVRLSMFDFDETLSKETRMNLKSVNKTTFFAADLLKQFNAFFKDTSIAKKPCDIATIVKESAGIVQSNGEVYITIGRLDALPPVEGVSQQLMQVFLNLFINAKQAITGNGRVFVSGDRSPTGNEVIITVKDNGCGMSPEVAERIFQPFFTTKKSGSGLGLAIVADIIKKHNGNISVSSIEGSGTTFTIALPAAGWCGRGLGIVPEVSADSKRN